MRRYEEVAVGVCVGTASGPIEGFNLRLLAMKGSLYLARPALADYIADPAEKEALATSCSVTGPAGGSRESNQGYAQQDAAQVHCSLESRQIRVVQGIPKTCVGKVNKTLIREQEMGAMSKS
ncbi:hypothetical protein ACW5WQ_00455 [Aeromonas rivuli]|uniref:hypothetical protein n=1 Tax=Aeromonas rivuli TaxID=648794 RepID=UPI0005AA08BE|nr:hypothetical protein [Aeromonas rivuli]